MVPAGLARGDRARSGPPSDAAAGRTPAPGKGDPHGELRYPPGPGENGAPVKHFSPNLLLFWLKTNMTVTNRRLAIKAPNTVLGVIPPGYEERSVPMGAIAGVTASISVKVGQLIGFGLLALFCLLMVGGADGGGAKLFPLILTLPFGAMAANGIVPKLTVTNSGGGTSEATVSFLGAGQPETFRRRLNEDVHSAGPAGQSWQQAGAQGDHGHPEL